MNMPDISTGSTAWDDFMQHAARGSSVSAMRFLSLLASDSADAMEDAFADLLDAHITLDISDLPTNVAVGASALRLRREAELVKKGDYCAELEENDPLRLFLREVSALPADDDVQPLADELARTHAEATRLALAERSMRRVIELAEAHTGRGVLLMDLIQEGSLALWEALALYDGGDFARYRDWHIRQYMARAVTLQTLDNGIAQKLRRDMRDYRAVDERLLAELGRNPTIQEIAQGMHVSVEEAQRARSALDAARSVNRAQPPEPQEQDDPDREQPVESTAYFQTRQQIGQLLGGLAPAQKQLIALRFGLEGGVPLTPEQTAARLGLTAQQVLAQEAEALAKMREIDKGE